ncbi:PTS sugar transporter subunit IIB [Olsenella sp. Marseille-QA0557]|uniref:PTS sugar transporter subunit IIB n=1 Tax=Olsenella sp. Marseille-QA0557 TaxID=3378782 RepID=UPI003D10692D
MKTKHILVVCGAGVTSSMLVSARLRELLDGEGLKDTYDITPCKADLAAAVSPDYDLIVATSTIPDETSCPVIDGTPFLNDRGICATESKVLATLGYELAD